MIGGGLDNRVGLSFVEAESGGRAISFRYRSSHGGLVVHSNKSWSSAASSAPLNGFVRQIRCLKRRDYERCLIMKCIARK